MNHYRTPLRDIEFTLFELLGYDQHCRALGSNLDRELVKTFLSEAGRFAEHTLAPLNPIGDIQGCHLEQGKVVTPEGFASAYRQYCDAGWPTLARSPEFGGQGLLQSMAFIISEILGTPNWAWGMYAGLSQGAMYTLEKHGTPEQKRQFLPSLISGRWTGTMCLTEAHCGSDLGMLQTRAEPQSDGSFLIRGNKIFISSGDHDLAENIVHIVLARLPDAPAGTKGISVFVVPKMNVDSQGTIVGPNRVSCGAVESKMGIHGNATCELVFDGAQGWLVGEAHKGLLCMFTFMNLARIGTGIQGLAHAEWGYQHARTYAQERLQMRSLSGIKNPDGPADPIIVHPDVRRMLFTQKAILEGLRMLIYSTSLKSDEAEQTDDEPKARNAADLLGLLTPIVKAFATEMGFESANLALQCFGGHGYLSIMGLEQNVRDCRIATLYEGTTGIQALDLMGRKVVANQGQLIRTMLADIQACCAHIKDDPRLAAYFAQLAELECEWVELSRLVGRRAESNPDEIGAAAVDYLMYSGYLLLATLWIRAAAVALKKLDDHAPDPGFYQAKLATAEFYFARLLPRTKAHVAAIRSGADNLMALASDYF